VSKDLGNEIVVGSGFIPVQSKHSIIHISKTPVETWWQKVKNVLGGIKKGEVEIVCGTNPNLVGFRGQPVEVVIRRIDKSKKDVLKEWFEGDLE